MISKLLQCHTCEACRKLKGHDNQSTIEQKVQFNQAVSLRLIPLTRLSRQNALLCRKMTFHIPHVLYYKYLIPTKCRELLERILREKSQRKPRLTHPQFQIFEFLNSSTLTLSIDISLRGTFAKYLSHHTYISEEVFWYLGSSSEMTNLLG